MEKLVSIIFKHSHSRPHKVYIANRVLSRWSVYNDRRYLSLTFCCRALLEEKTKLHPALTSDRVVTNTSDLDYVKRQPGFTSQGGLVLGALALKIFKQDLYFDAVSLWGVFVSPYWVPPSSTTDLWLVTWALLVAFAFILLLATVWIVTKALVSMLHTCIVKTCEKIQRKWDGKIDVHLGVQKTKSNVRMCFRET